jgi:hypothetical protein
MTHVHCIARGKTQGFVMAGLVPAIHAFLDARL